jgi:hypothetical protein
MIWSRMFLLTEELKGTVSQETWDNRTAIEDSKYLTSFILMPSMSRLNFGLNDLIISLIKTGPIRTKQSLAYCMYNVH